MTTPQPWSNHDHRFEQQMLGYILLGDHEGESRNAAFVRTSSTIERTDLHAEASRLVWGAMAATHAAGKEIDPYEIVAELMRDGTLKGAGGAQGVVSLTEGLISSVYLPQLTRNVLELSHRRQIVSVGSEVMHSAPRGDLNETLDAGAEKLKSLEVFGGRCLATHIGKGACLHAGEVVSGKPPRGSTTGFHALDIITHGWQPGDFVVVAARPAMGKTAFMVSSAIASARKPECQCVQLSIECRCKGKTALIVNYEMSQRQLYDRSLSLVAKVPLSGIMERTLDKRDQWSLGGAATQLAFWPLYDIDPPPATLSAFCTAVRTVHAQTPLTTVWVDYLQLMDGDRKKGDSREQEVASIPRRLKLLAKELQITIIALAQLNRGVESRDEKRPRLSDLRESGAIEQDADLVLFLYREWVYDEEKDPRQAEVIIAKHRQGAIGKVDMEFRGEIVTWKDLD